MTNQIQLQVRPPVQSAEVKDRIEAALRRSAEFDARGIQVDAKVLKPTPTEPQQGQVEELTGGTT